MPAFLNQKDAQTLDEDLMSTEGGFVLEQVSWTVTDLRGRHVRRRLRCRMTSQQQHEQQQHATDHTTPLLAPAHGTRRLVVRSSAPRRLP